MPRVWRRKTANQCIENTRDALTAAVAYLLEQGHARRPRRPWAGEPRTNVRLTAEEKALLEVVAKRKGFSRLSDYVRAAAVEMAK